MSLCVCLCKWVCVFVCVRVCLWGWGMLKKCEYVRLWNFISAWKGRSGVHKLSAQVIRVEVAGNHPSRSESFSFRLIRLLCSDRSIFPLVPSFSLLQQDMLLISNEFNASVKFWYFIYTELKSQKKKIQFKYEISAQHYMHGTVYCILNAIAKCI